MPENEPGRHEVLDGNLYATPGPRLNHQRVAADLGMLMRTIARQDALGEVVGSMTVHVNDEMVFQPDLIFIRADRMEIADPEGHVHGVPDLAIEVLSPSTRSYDRSLKRKHYFASGLPELWLVDIDARSVEVWRAGADEPLTVRDTLTWRVGDRAIELPSEEVFQGVWSHGLAGNA